MTKLPRISGSECVKALTKAGFYKKRQHGSHIILRRDDPFAQIVVPEHKELDPGGAARYPAPGRPQHRSVRRSGVS